MTYKALIKTAASYLYDAQSDLQVLAKRRRWDDDRCMFMRALQGVKYALKDLELVFANNGVHNNGAAVYTAAVYIEISIRAISKVKRYSDRSPVTEALLRAIENLKYALRAIDW